MTQISLVPGASDTAALLQRAVKGRSLWDDARRRLLRNPAAVGGMIEALHSNYVRTARAKGLPEWRIVTKHALRAAVLPLVSYLGPAFAGLMTGSLVVEKIFGLPGLGKFFVNSALQRDYTVVMGMVIFFATLILALNLLADLLYAVLDPRVRLA